MISNCTCILFYVMMIYGKDKDMAIIDGFQSRNRQFYEKVIILISTPNCVRDIYGKLTQLVQHLNSIIHTTA